LSIKDKLQIILITYNRLKHVMRTFEQLFAENSSIKDYDILVLDNNSTDGTGEFVKDFIATHPNVRYQKNKYNIGISANIAKAMEIAEKEYVWIICDDDKYDFSNWAEVETAISKGENLICVARFALTEENKNDVAQQVLQATFLPAMIFKTSTFTDTVIRNAFDNIFAVFPHLCPFLSLINQGKPIYIIDKPIVDNGRDVDADCSFTRGQNPEQLYHRTITMTWIVGYVNTCSIIKDVKLKQRMFSCGVDRIHGGFSNFCDYVLTIYSAKENRMHLVDLFGILTDQQQAIFVEKFFEKGIEPEFLKYYKEILIQNVDKQSVLQKTFYVADRVGTRILKSMGIRTKRGKS